MRGPLAVLCLVIASLVMASFVVATVSASVPIDTSNPDVSGARIQSGPSRVADAWTAADMRAAVPATVPSPAAAAFDLPDFGGATASAGGGTFIPGDPSARPLRAHGKVFFRLGDQEYVCSGTVVSSKGRNVVMTAGHCVYDRETSSYASELVFVPAYDGGAANQAPFGVRTASAVFTSSVYAEQGRLSHDVGAVVLSKPVEGAVGSRGIAFDLDAASRSFRIFGYPELPSPPFDGNSLVGCDSVEIGRDGSYGRPSPIAAGPCLMQGGSSGGGWITGGGYLNSVVSYGYCDDEPSLCGLIYGPYFSGQAKTLYTYPAVGGAARPTVRFASGPKGATRKRSAKFSFSGSGSTPVSFRCRLDRRSYVKCGSKVIVRRLSPGRHVLRVRSIDQTGQTSGKTARRTFRVLRRS